MRVIIAGGRNVELTHQDIKRALRRAKLVPTEIVSGGASGADQAGERWAQHHKVPLRIFPAEWGKYGKGAGPRRNQQMAEYAEALIAFWDGQSAGTSDMSKLGLQVHIVRCA